MLLQPFNESHIAVALINNSKLYTCSVGYCRIILCKTDNNNVLRAVQMSADSSSSKNNSNETVSSTNLEIVGPILLNETHRFLVLMSFGLCKTLEEIHNHEQQNINREVIQAVVQQFRTQRSLRDVAQTVIERINSKYGESVKIEDEEQMSRVDSTLMIRNFNFPLQNDSNSHGGKLTYSVAAAADSCSTDTIKSNYTDSSTTTTSSNRSEVFDKNIRINPYVDFTDYYKNVCNSANHD